MSAAVPGRARSGSHRLPDAEYDALLAAQGGTCAICGSTPKTRRLHVDREHRNGEVRGLLCYMCNRRLDQRVTPQWCARAALYLLRFMFRAELAAGETAALPTRRLHGLVDEAGT